MSLHMQLFPSAIPVVDRHLFWFPFFINCEHYRNHLVLAHLFYEIKNQEWDC